MKVGDLVKFKDDVDCYGDMNKASRGVVVRAEPVDPNECVDPSCKYFVYVKWAGVDHGFVENKYWPYHDIDLDVLNREVKDG
jgi:hypothetical protein